MPTQRERKGPTTEEKRRVLEAYSSGNPEWKIVAEHNGVSLSTAQRVAKNNRAEALPRGGKRLTPTKVTPNILNALERYHSENCQYTLGQMQEFIISSTMHQRTLNPRRAASPTRICLCFALALIRLC